MVRGFYSAASGIMSKQKSIDAISNNIANMAVTGYKSQTTVESSFRDHLVSRMSPVQGAGRKNIGPGSFMTANGGAYVDFTQGALENTGRSVDLAIQGEGFFLVQSEKYGSLLTRNGQFELDDEGDLILPGVGKVQGDDNRPINLRNSSFTVEDDGTIRIGGRESAKLYIASNEGDHELVKIGAGTFFRSGNYNRSDNEDFNIVQGFIERANVNISKEMSRIIASQGNFQSCSQVLKIYDKINEITVNNIGSIG
ncbi:MAG TPA: flagellar hook basal-body protein [Anaerovoracaceae bacterium]|nr:flagellar hook basal-body protein [Anaerovoracaceae bacterium]